MPASGTRGEESRTHERSHISDNENKFAHSAAQSPVFKQGDDRRNDESPMLDHSPIGGEGHVRSSNDLMAAEKILFIPAGAGANAKKPALTSKHSPMKPW